MKEGLNNEKMGSKRLPNQTLLENKNSKRKSEFRLEFWLCLVLILWHTITSCEYYKLDEKPKRNIRHSQSFKQIAWNRISNHICLQQDTLFFFILYWWPLKAISISLSHRYRNRLTDFNVLGLGSSSTFTPLRNINRYENLRVFSALHNRRNSAKICGNFLDWATSGSKFKSAVKYRFWFSPWCGLFTNFVVPFLQNLECLIWLCSILVLILHFEQMQLQVHWVQWDPIRVWWLRGEDLCNYLPHITSFRATWTVTFGFQHSAGGILPSPFCADGTRGTR